MGLLPAADVEGTPGPMVVEGGVHDPISKRRDRNPIGPDVPRGLVDQSALADAGLAVHDHGGRASLPGRPSNRSANHFELMRAPEEPGHARHITGTSFWFASGSEGDPS